MGRGLPSRLRGLGERRELRPRQKRVLEYLELEKNTPDSHKSIIFDISAAHI